MHDRMTATIILNDLVLVSHAFPIVITATMP